MPCLALKLFDFSQLLIRKNSHNCICLNCYETGKHNFQLSRNNSIMGRTLRYLFRGEGAQPHWVQKALETKNFTDPWRLTPPPASDSCQYTPKRQYPPIFALLVPLPSRHLGERTGANSNQFLGTQFSRYLQNTGIIG